MACHPLLENPLLKQLFEDNSFTSAQISKRLAEFGHSVSASTVRSIRRSIFGKQVAESYGLKRSFIEKIEDPQPEGSTFSPSPVDESHDLTGNTWTISIPRTRIKTLEELLSHCEVDTAIWEVDRFVVNKWEVGTSSDGVIVTEPLFQVKAWLKRNRIVADVKSEIENLKADFKEFVLDNRPSPRIYSRATFSAPTAKCYLLEVSIPDIHMGKRAWHEETGVDYDLEIAEAAHDRALDDLLEKTSAYPIDRICYVVGNDLLNADNLANTTTKGTPQQVDGRYALVYRTTRRMLVRAVERMVGIADVDVLIVPGNHDRQSAFCMGDSLECWFHGHEQVRVNNSPALRKYYEYGSNMLCFTHGNEEKLDRLPQIMAAEEPQMWGRTRQRECHIGHWHKTRLDEHHGVRVRILPSLCGTDDWHAKIGLVGAVRSAEAYVWSWGDGLVGHSIHNITE